MTPQRRKAARVKRSERVSESGRVSLSLDIGALDEAAAALREANLAFVRRYPGGDGRWQPVHTLIEGAQYFRHDVTAQRGRQALEALEQHAADAETLAAALGLPTTLDAQAVHAHVRAKLAAAPVDDYRIDFEDGFGIRSDTEEDAEVERVAMEVVRGMRERSLPPALGVRIKPLTEELRARSIRTLDLLLTAVAGSGAMPERWITTLPKVVVAEQVAYFAAVLRSLEGSLTLADGTLRFEIQVEAPQVILDRDGRSHLPRILDAAEGRLAAVNLGVYDYTAACGVTAAHQRLRHPACEHARHVMQVAFAGTGVQLADGSTARLPVGPYEESAELDAGRRAANRDGVHAGWRLHFEDVRHSLANGFYQGWDLHAAQLVSRHAAVASFYMEGVDAAVARLRAFLAKAEQAVLVGGVLDEPATGQGLLEFVRRAMHAGALTERDAVERCGLTAAELREPSFVRILQAREQAGAR